MSSLVKLCVRGITFTCAYRFIRNWVRPSIEKFPRCSELGIWIFITSRRMRRSVQGGPKSKPDYYCNNFVHCPTNYISSSCKFPAEYMCQKLWELVAVTNQAYFWAILYSRRRFGRLSEGVVLIYTWIMKKLPVMVLVAIFAFALDDRKTYHKYRMLLKITLCICNISVGWRLSDENV